MRSSPKPSTHERPPRFWRSNLDSKWTLASLTKSIFWWKANCRTTLLLISLVSDFQIFLNLTMKSYYSRVADIQNFPKDTLLLHSPHPLMDVCIHSQKHWQKEKKLEKVGFNTSWDELYGMSIDVIDWIVSKRWEETKIIWRFTVVCEERILKMRK